MAGFMQPFVVTLPRSRPLRRTFYQVPSLEQDFADVLGDLIAAKKPRTETEHCCTPGRCTRRDNTFSQPFWYDIAGLKTRRPWVHVLNMNGFEASDIDVKVENGSLFVHAKREETDGENCDVMERKREIKLPQNVDAEKVACFLSEDGRFIIKAPYTSKDDAVKKEQQQQQQQQQEREANRDPKNVAPEEAIDVPIRHEGDNRPATTSLADFIVSALTGDFPNSTRVKRNDRPMSHSGETETHEMAPLGDSTEIIEDDGKKFYCVKVKLPNYPPESIRVRCHGRSMYVDAKREVEESGIYHCHEFHRRYTLPENAADGEAKAQIDESGLVTVSVPLMEVKAPESVEIPIERVETKAVEDETKPTEKPKGQRKTKKEVSKETVKGNAKDLKDTKKNVAAS